ncbi:MAG TPA: hypothetical protein DCP03_00725 [Polaromonas sp.]|uniref:hypothetical protein n=1 Tax=Polaromonas sp. UBA4122 TaxID=1947074 RepID=UPI000EEE5521|nr:hypothetical protein [Polaromonas sp. UBA4122]HAL36711.1 hypothetical protein [Polaromonas sp.]
MTEIRNVQAPAVLSRNVSHVRFMPSFIDPAFRAEGETKQLERCLTANDERDGGDSPRISCCPTAAQGPEIDNGTLEVWVVPYLFLTSYAPFYP